MQLMNELEREIDLIDLQDDELDIFVKMNILNDGIVIYTNDNEQSLDYVKEITHRVFKENEDYFYFRKRDVLG